MRNNQKQKITTAQAINHYIIWIAELGTMKCAALLIGIFFFVHTISYFEYYGNSTMIIANSVFGTLSLWILIFAIRFFGQQGYGICKIKESKAKP